jgi:monoamine oxidase
MSLHWSRRRFLHAVGLAGGSVTAYRTALALGLAPPVATFQRPDLAPADSGRRPRVAVLGAGISGLTAAYELQRKGYEVVILDASHRAGGRNLTLRHGDLIDEIGDPRTCGFDADPELYFNAGPARIAPTHTALLEYCRELQVPLMPFINDNRHAWMQDDRVLGGARLRAREYLSATRGFLAELAAKALDPAALDAPLNRGDFDATVAYLRDFGDLNADLRYAGSTRAGLASDDALAPERAVEPLDAREILRSGFLTSVASFGEQGDQAAMMLQPVGGMDRIVAGFLGRVGRLVRTRSSVLSVDVDPNGVRIECNSPQGRQQYAVDYCLTSIPARLLARITHNFPADYAAALAQLPTAKLFKIGFQMKQRFWERDGIYGGISWTAQDIMQLWYPSHGLQGNKGVVLGAYTWDDDVAERLTRLPHAARLELAMRQAEKLHPGYASYVESGVSVPWSRMNHVEGCAAIWSDEFRERCFSLLQKPVGGHYLIGDQMSCQAGWQEGAIQAAFYAIADIDRRERAKSAAAAAA